MFRGKNKPTNVLSFPAGEDMSSGDTPVMAGEIAMSFETLQAEARDEEKSLGDHLTHLWVHGLLHLMGHDHESDDEADIMEAGEVRVLARLGIDNPYADADGDDGGDLMSAVVNAGGVG
jgi:probable rRNA maturation factor